MALNDYVIKDLYIDKFKDVITSYYNEQIKNFDNFTAYVFWKVNDSINYKKTVPNMRAYGQKVYSIPINITETAGEFLDKDIRGYPNLLTIDKIEEVEIVFISDLKEMTYTHYVQQPKSMLYRKKIRRFFEVKVRILMISSIIGYLVVCV